jgi:hypothetical protein
LRRSATQHRHTNHTCAHVEHARARHEVALQQLQADRVHVRRADGLALADAQRVVLRR